MRKTTSYVALGIVCSMLLGGCSSGREQTVGEKTKIEQQTAQEQSVGDENEAMKQETPAKKSDEISETDGAGSSEVATAEPNQQQEQNIQKICVTATGDCTLGKMQDHGYENSFYWYYDKNGADYFFKGVKDVFEKDDFTLINLECVLSKETEHLEKEYCLKGEPEYTSIMTGSSVEACSLGNNHSMDYGYQSLIDTQENLDKAGIVYGYNTHVGVYTTKDGMRVGIVSSSLLSQSIEVENYQKDGIRQLQEQGVELIIACCHWGIEREYYPDDYQKRMAHELIDCGADLVVGNHPHVLQGIELYNNKVICYSLGNFCFGGNRDPADKNTMMYQQTFTYVNGVLQAAVDAQIIPCTLSSAATYNDFQPTIVAGEKKQDIIDKVNTYSAAYSNIKFDKNGKLTISE